MSAVPHDICRLILWAREHRVQLTRVRQGDVELDLLDLELADGVPAPAPAKEWTPEAPPGPQTVYDHYATELGVKGVSPAKEEP